MKCRWCGGEIFKGENDVWWHEFSVDGRKWMFCLNAIGSSPESSPHLVHPNGYEMEAVPSEGSIVNEILKRYGG